MKSLAQIPLILGLGVALSFFSSTPVIQAQEAPQGRRSNQTVVSDEELKAFARSYIKFHQIRAEYEPILENAPAPEERGKIEQEALAKFGKEVQKEGLTLESYGRIFLAVNSDEKLREKTLRLIDAERRKSA